MTYRTRISALVAASALVVAACSSDDTPETTDTTTPDTTVTPTSIDDTTTTDPPATTATVPATDQPTTTTAPPTTPLPVTTEPPATTVPGEPDWLEIVTELRAIMDEIVANPDPSRIPEVAVEGGEWDTVTGSAIRNKLERGERTIGLEPTTVVSAEFTGTIDDVPLDEARAVTVEVVIEASDLSNAQIVDSEGNVVFDLVNDNEPGELLTSFWLLARTDDGWRVARILT